MKIEDILKKYVRPTQLLGADPVKHELLKDLRAQKRVNSVIYGIPLGMVCVVTLIAIAAVATDLVKGQQARTNLLAGAGIAVPVMLEWMRRIVREWSQLNLLITLISHDNETGVQAVIQKLLSGPAFGAQGGG